MRTRSTSSGQSRGKPPSTFAIVGVGASAEGLEAFRQLFAHVPDRSGLAFVLVQHLEATRASQLSDALATSTTMRVVQAEEGVRVEPDHVYVIPPGTQMAIVGGVLELSRLGGDERRPTLPVDHFFHSLAADRGRQAIGVVLSGNSSDGTSGLSAIRESGGITFAQDPRYARAGAMPRSAIDAGVVDFCLPVPAMGMELGRLSRHPYLARGELLPPTPVGAASVAEVVALVRTSTGIDFGEHEPATFERRLARRMVVRNAKDLAAYLELLREDPAETRLLHDDLLIKATSSFRDEHAFDELRTVAFPAILKDKAPGSPVRAWVMGCATGEEVYSLAISLIEHLGDNPSGHPIVIFGSDLDEKAIRRARAGLYPESTVHRLGEERLRRFFVRTAQGWRVSKAVRELCVFVRHDVARDPPFSRLDLVSCRNVLAHFALPLQRRVVAAAHYCLNQPGFLLLGPTEGAVGLAKWFTSSRKGEGLLSRKPGRSTFRFARRAGSIPFGGLTSTAEGVPLPRTETSLARQADSAVLDRYGPPGVVVNDCMEVLQFRGRTGPYLEPPVGEPQRQLLKMARSGLAAPLRIAIAQARRTSAAVRTENVRIDGDAAGRACDLVVLPVQSSEGGDRAFVVLFEERPRIAKQRAPSKPRGRSSGAGGSGSRALEDELTSTKEYVAVLLEEQGRATDAVASANDELQSLNDELQTAKEQLQSTNEELTAVNDELNGRNVELEVVNADVLNLLDAVEIPILMLDGDRRIRRYTRRAAAFLGLKPAAVGRRVNEVDLPLLAPDLKPWIARSMREGILVESEVQDRSDRWHRLQIRPRQAVDGRTDGVILSLVDIDELRHQVVDARWARDYARSIVEAVQVPLVVLDCELRVLSANAAYYGAFRQVPAQIEGQGFFDLGAGEWNTTELRRAVGDVLGSDERFQGLQLKLDVPGVGRMATSVSGCAVPSPGGERMVLLSIEDVTERRSA